MLTLKFLGPPQVTVRGQVVKFRSRKVLALLVYLVVAGRQHSREKLIALLWPDADRKQGQASLRNTLLRLRESLGDASGCLLIESATVSFDESHPHDLDLNRLQSASQAPKQIPSSQALAAHLRSHNMDHAAPIAAARSPHDLAPLQSALAAYRGEFLEGFTLNDAPEFDNWASQQREHWHQRTTHVFDHLSWLQFERGLSAPALETATRWLAHDPLDETAYRRLMQIHLALDNRTAALQTYEQCRRVLADELGVAPAAETRTLVEHIRKPESKNPTTEAQTNPLTSSDSPPAHSDLPFVGRASEHAHLVARYQAVRAGQSQVVCVAGEAGIGKTRLSQTFLAWAAAHGADVLHGRTFEASGQLPYQPLVDALRRRLERENAPEDLLADVWLAELAQLLPELRERYPDLAMPVTNDPNLARSRLFETIAKLGQAIAERTTVIWFVDDVQWADAATLELLLYLGRTWGEARTPILLLLTLRTEALLTTPLLRDWLAQLEREAALTRVSLSPLNAEATMQFVRMLAARTDTITQQFGAWLFDETAGQPFFIAETIKMLVEQHARPTRQAGERWAAAFEAAMQQIQRRQPMPVPVKVREVILTRLRRLSKAANHLLIAGAVLGRACRFEQLCEVSGVGELEGLAALDELLQGHLLLETAEARQPYIFAHDKIRDVAYTEAGDARRRIYHRRAFVALQAESAPAAELVQHAYAARMWASAWHYSVAAGDAAAQVYAQREAAAHYRRALELAKQLSAKQAGERPFKTADLIQLYLQLGRTLELDAQHSEALLHYRELEALAQTQHERAMELAALLAQMTLLATVNAVFDPKQAEAIAQRALPLAQALGDLKVEAKILWNQLIIYRNDNQLPQAIVCGKRALALTRQLDWPELTAYVLHDLGYCCAFMADYARAKAWFGEAITLWRVLNNQPLLGDSLVGTCFVNVLTGEYDEAIACFEEALHISQHINSVWALAGSRHNIGFVYGERGQLTEAIAIMEECLRLSEQVSFISPLIVTRADLAVVYSMLGDAERANALAQRAIQEAETRLPVFRVYALNALAQLHLSLEQAAEAAEVIARMQHDPYNSGIGFFPALILLAEGELALLLKRYSQAQASLAQATQEIRRLNLRAFLPRALYLQGQAYVKLGQANLARECWLEAYAVGKAMNARRWLWPVLLALGAVAGNVGETEQRRAEARGIMEYIAAQIPLTHDAVPFDLIPHQNDGLVHNEWQLIG